MMLDANARALTAAGIAAWAAGELRFAGLHDGQGLIREAAAECVAPLLQSALIAMELAGLLSEENSAGVRDVIRDYITAPPQNAETYAPLIGSRR